MGCHELQGGCGCCVGLGPGGKKTGERCCCCSRNSRWALLPRKKERDKNIKTLSNRIPSMQTLEPSRSEKTLQGHAPLEGEGSKLVTSNDFVPVPDSDHHLDLGFFNVVISSCWVVLMWWTLERAGARRGDAGACGDEIIGQAGAIYISTIIRTCELLGFHRSFLAARAALEFRCEMTFVGSLSRLLIVSSSGCVLSSCFWTGFG